MITIAKQRTLKEWEQIFSAWSVGPSVTEKERCERTEAAIRNAIDQDPRLSMRNIRVFTQGSYRNRTNVRQDSDIDVCVLCKDTFIYDLTFAEGMTPAGAGISAASYDYAVFKNEVGQALNNYFGASAVRRGNKAFDIHANTYRVDADVVPCFEHRRYNSLGGYDSGTELQPDNGGSITNWPDQQYANGVQKHLDTKTRFKKIVRILKSLRYQMEDEGIAEAKNVPSYLIECLIWNVPNDLFVGVSFCGDLRSALYHLWYNTQTQERCNEWGEVNEMKYLFRLSQPWTRERAHNFLTAAWNYVGFQSS